MTDRPTRRRTADGSFVVEAFVPDDLLRLRDDQYVSAERITVDEVTLDVARHDPVTEQLDESHIVPSPDGVRLVSVYGP